VIGESHVHKKSHMPVLFFITSSCLLADFFEKHTPRGNYNNNYFILVSMSSSALALIGTLSKLELEFGNVGTIISSNTENFEKESRCDTKRDFQYHIEKDLSI